MSHSSTTMVHSNVQAETGALIPIDTATIDGQTIESVDARNLHSFLKSRKDFSSWIKERIAKYGFVEGKDYIVVLTQTGEAQPRGFAANRKEYHLSLDMAKELSMVERNEKGKEARQYFIECERRSKEPLADPMKALNDPAILREVLLGYSERVMELESTVSEQAPKVDAYDRISNAEGSLCLTDASKYLQVQRKRLIAWLHANRWIYRRVGNKNWVAYEERRKQQVLTHKTTTITLDDGSERLCEQVRVTPKGLAKLAVVFDQEAAA